MSTTPTANTLLTTSIRIAKIVGTVGAAYAAGGHLGAAPAAYGLQHIKSTPDLTAAITTLRTRLQRPLTLATTSSAFAFAYVALQLYRLHGRLQRQGEWYAGAAAAMTVTVLWRVMGMRAVERRLAAAARGEILGEKKGRGAQVPGGWVTAVEVVPTVRTDVDVWASRCVLGGLLAGVGAFLGGWAVEVA